MKILFLYAHSQEASFNAALLNAAVEAARAEGHEVVVSDLYAMNFNPVASADDFKERRFPGHLQYDREQKHAVQTRTFSDYIATEIEKLLWCDMLILQFTLWWYGVPAIMKGWFDRVFANGLMYGQIGRFNHGGLKGKRAMVSMTTGCYPEMVGSGGVMGHLDAMRARAEACGVALAEDGFVFSHVPDGGEAWYPASVSRSFKRLCDREGIANVRLHDLRHFVATQLLGAGVDVRTVAGRLGHRNAATTLNVYAHFLEQSDRAAADVIGGLISRPKPKRPGV